MLLNVNEHFFSRRKVLVQLQYIHFLGCLLNHGFASQFGYRFICLIKILNSYPYYFDFCRRTCVLGILLPFSHCFLLFSFPNVIDLLAHIISFLSFVLGNLDLIENPCHLSTLISYERIFFSKCHSSHLTNSRINNRVRPLIFSSLFMVFFLWTSKGHL